MEDAKSLAWHPFTWIVALQEAYEYLMKKVKANKESWAEKRKKLLEEFEKQMKKKQRP